MRLDSDWGEDPVSNARHVQAGGGNGVMEADLGSSGGVYRLQVDMQALIYRYNHVENAFDYYVKTLTSTYVLEIDTS